MHLSINLSSLLILLALYTPNKSETNVLRCQDCKFSFHVVDEPDQEVLQDTTLMFKANSDKGFNFDYVIYFPEVIDTSLKTTLLVESSNTGADDSLDHHLNRAIYAASKSSVGNFVSRKLNIPILVPVFPRSRTNWEVNTHAVDSDTFNQRGTDNAQIDLQLLAMVEDAKVRLKEFGIELDERFFLTGFSASGTFANRFALLHPEKLKAVAAGGLNGLLIIPKSFIMTIS